MSLMCLGVEGLSVDVYVVFFFKQKTAYEVSAWLVGSEVCIRGRNAGAAFSPRVTRGTIIWYGALGGTFPLPLGFRRNLGEGNAPRVSLKGTVVEVASNPHLPPPTNKEL